MFTRRFSAFIPRVSIAAVLLAAFPIMAHADGVVKSDFVFQLDNSVFKSPEFEIAARLQGEERFSLPDTVIVREDVPVEIKGIEAAVTYKMSAGSKHVLLGAEHMIAADELSASIAIRRIAVDTVVERIVNGIKVKVRVQAQCEGIRLELPKGAARVTGTFKSGVDQAGLPYVEVPWFDVAWNEKSWAVGDFACTGVSGFKERVQAALLDYLKDPSAFTSEMKAAVNDEVAEQRAKLRQWFLEPKPISVEIAGLRVTLHPKAIVGYRAEQFQVRGELEFAFASATYHQMIEVRAPAMRPESSGFVLYLPEGLIEALKEAAYQSGFFSMRKRGLEIEAFKEIRKDLINEVWVWPELQLYPKNAEFLFDFSLGRSPLLSGLTADSLGAPIGNLDAQVDVQSWAPKSGGHQKFTFFRVPMRGQYRLTIESGELKALFSGLQMSVKAQWDAEYAKKLRFEDVNTDRMRDELAKSLTTTGARIPLGKLSLTQQLNLAPTQISKEGSWLRLDWK